MLAYLIDQPYMDTFHNHYAGLMCSQPTSMWFLTNYYTPPIHPFFIEETLSYSSNLIHKTPNLREK